MTDSITDRALAVRSRSRCALRRRTGSPCRPTCDGPGHTHRLEELCTLPARRPNYDALGVGPLCHVLTADTGAEVVGIDLSESMFGREFDEAERGADDPDGPFPISVDGEMMKR